MKTIEERAREYAEKEDLLYYTDEFKYCQKDYIAGATEQKAIDDAECVNQILMGKGSVNTYKQGFHDAVDKFCELLKHNWREYIYQDGDGIVHFGHWEADMRKAMEE